MDFLDNPRLLGRGLVESFRDHQRAASEELRAALDRAYYGTSITRDGQRVDPHDFYAQPETDPMKSIDIHCCEISNGVLVTVDTDLERPKSQYFPSWEAAGEAMPLVVGSALASFEKGPDAYPINRDRPGANEHGIGPDVGEGANAEYVPLPEEEVARSQGDFMGTAQESDPFVIGAVDTTVDHTD